MAVNQDGSAVHPTPSTEASDTDRDKIFDDETDQGYVTFNRRFTYLGSIITDDLEDSAEIHSRIGKANGILHSLNNLWRNKGLYVRMKKQFYIATVVNIVLWGCESLTIRAVDLKKPEVLHHKTVRHILCISRNGNRQQQNSPIRIPRYVRKYLHQAGLCHRKKARHNMLLPLATHEVDHESRCKYFIFEKINSCRA
jgi:hypothetical protein